MVKGATQNMNSVRRLFTGRVNRSNWLTGFIAVSVISFVLILVLDLALGFTSLALQLTGLNVLFWIVAAVIVVIVLVWSVLAISLHVRRLHDLDNSGWWLLLALIPFVAFLLFLYFLIRKGTPDSNKYGEVPPQGIQGVGLWPIIFNSYDV